MPKRSEPERCAWTEDEDGNWHTGCGAMWCFEYRLEDDANMRFCATCGKPLGLVPWKDAGDDDYE